MTTRPISAIVLAAGAGTRMKSERPKPLHAVCGQPMVRHMLNAVTGNIVPDWLVLVVGHKSEQITRELREQWPAEKAKLHFVEQHVQRGTGDAVAIALASLPGEVGEDADEADVIVLPGDMPLLDAGTVEALLQKHRDTDAAATLLVAETNDPTGYGRIVRDKHDRIQGIVEERDLTDDMRSIQQVNTAVYCFRTALLSTALRKIDDKNAQGELLLTDVIKILANAGHRIESLVAPGADWAVGVNDRQQLAAAETQMRARIAEQWMKRGVSMTDPHAVALGPDVELEQDVTFIGDVRLSGACRVASGARLGPGVTLHDCVVESEAVVTHVTGEAARVGANAIVGPYVVLQQGAQIAPHTSTGSFVSLGG